MCPDHPDPLTAAALGARGGDREAARQFVVSTQQQVWRLLVHLADRSVAEDLTQETYERAFLALPRFRGESSARTWLFAIARRVAADHLRRRSRRPLEVASIDDDAVVAAEPGDHTERIALGHLVRGLSAERREAFVLTQMLGLDYQEAAEVVGCPVGTIRSRVSRARADLVDGVHGTGRAETG